MDPAQNPGGQPGIDEDADVAREIELRARRQVEEQIFFVLRVVTRNLDRPGSALELEGDRGIDEDLEGGITHRVDARARAQDFHGQRVGLRFTGEPEAREHVRLEEIEYGEA